MAFWGLTPREWAVWMDGAAGRDDGLRRLHAIAAWVGAQLTQKGLMAHLAAIGRREPAERTPEALDRMLRSQSIGLREMTMAEYLERKGVIQ